MKKKKKIHSLTILLVSLSSCSLLIQQLLKSNELRECMMFKGTVHQKMKIVSYLTKHQVVPNLYEFLSSIKHKRRYFEEFGEPAVGPHCMEACFHHWIKIKKVTATFCLTILTELHYTNLQLWDMKSDLHDISCNCVL